MRIALVFCLLCSLLMACNHQPASENSTIPAVNVQPVEETTPAEPITEKGNVLPAVPLHKSPDNTFSIYLPQQYDSARAWPAMLLFNSNANGASIVESYKQLADKHGYILACSNSDFDKMSGISGSLEANNLLADLRKRVKVDKDKIVFAGFGSGAKIAIDAACGNPDVDAVVYIGSVLLWGTLNHDIEFLGMVGEKDMNYSELLSFNESKYLKDRPHYFMVFKGGHEWPDARVFEAAFQLPYSSLPADKLYKVDDAVKKNLELEKQLRQTYHNALTGQGTDWWRAEAVTLHKRKTGDAMYARLLEMLSLQCYKLSASYLAKNDLLNAEKVINAYALIDPGNKDQQTFAHQLKVRKGS